MHAGGGQVLEAVVGSLVSAECALPAKLARLYVLSDLLHNAGLPLPNVWRYRSGYAAAGAGFVLMGAGEGRDQLAHSLV
jgi:hypothetical protein